MLFSEFFLNPEPGFFPQYDSKRFLAPQEKILGFVFFVLGISYAIIL